ncbi:hypothetical protein MAR_025471, partial [Mya arenaria]
RVVSRKVDESIFFRLVQYFAVVLFECNEAEDFLCGESGVLRTSCTFIYENNPSGSHCDSGMLHSLMQSRTSEHINQSAR